MMATFSLLGSATASAVKVMNKSGKNNARISKIQGPTRKYSTVEASLVN
jgi:hypothetical protein